MFHGRKFSQIKIDVVFQILHYALSGGKEPTPLHIMVAEGVYSLTRSKELVPALNRHGICASYNTVRRIVVDLADWIITTAGDNRMLLPAVFKTTSPLNVAMDNFDHSTSKADIKDETIKALMFIEYGRHRGFLAEELLILEITRSAFFLVDKDGYVKKSVKLQLGTELLKLCPDVDPKANASANQSLHYRLHGDG